MPVVGGTIDGKAGLPWDLARITDVDAQASCCAKPGEEVAADPTTTVSGKGSAPMTIRRSQALHRLRSSWVDIAWVIFVGLNLAAMRLLPAWQTVPFLVIWVSLTVIYGFRMWRLQPTIMTLAAVTLATGGVIGVQVVQGQEEGQYLVEVPLIAMMFLVMVWHGRRRLATMAENLRLLEQQRRFIQDASHELGTPITVALGHTQLIEQAATDPLIASDARVVADELLRLRRLATRLLLLASAGSPDFLDLAPVEVNPLMVDALSRWSKTPRRWSHRLGPMRPCWATATTWPWPWMRCSKTPSRTPTSTGASSCAPAWRAGRSCLGWRTRVVASRPPSSGGSSTGSPASMRIATGRSAGSASAWRS